VKARNSIDITLRRETTKTRIATTPSNSLKLSFTDVVDSSPWIVVFPNALAGNLAGDLMLRLRQDNMSPLDRPILVLKASIRKLS
jgi:hypothetical protein